MFNSLIKYIKEHPYLFAIILLSSFLRFYLLTKNPPSLNWDEVSHGFNAFSIIKTGKDEWGKMLPTIFRAYGDYKLPVYIYTTSLTELLFGINAFSVRLPSVIAGISMVIFTYLLVVELFGNTKSKNNSELNTHKIALTSSLLVAVEPWSLFLSRAAFEANLSQALILAGVYFFLKGIKYKKYQILSIVLLGLSVWTYNSARVFVPMLLAFLYLIYDKKLIPFEKNRKLLILHSALLTLFFLPMFFQLLNPVGQARYGKVAILDEGAINQIIEKRNSSDLPVYVNKLIYNRPTYFVSRFAVNWASHYSGNFLFFKGGSNYQFSIPNRGLLYIINLPFLLIGVFYLIKKRKRAGAILLIWFFISPIPSSLTREAPHVLRAVTILPTPMIFSAAGLVVFISWLKKRCEYLKPRYLYVSYVLLLGIFAYQYLSDYYNNYRIKYSQSWQYGYEEVVGYIKQNYAEYNKIIITKKYGEPHEFILFYYPWEPSMYQNDANLVRFYQSDWYWVDAFDKFYFVNDWQINEVDTGNYTFNLESKNQVQCTPRMYSCLLVTSPANVPDGWKKLETINFLDSQTAFEIYEN